MKKILMCDPSKASMVLTSEVFKDFFPGVQVSIAKDGAHALEIASTVIEPFDAIILDFDLPDTSGAKIAAKIKKVCQVPILLTGFDREDVSYEIDAELSAYEDCLNWVRKPIAPKALVEVAKRFCEGMYRTQRRIPGSVPAVIEFAFLKQGPEFKIPVTLLDVSVGGVKAEFKLPIGKSKQAAVGSFPSKQQIEKNFVTHLNLKIFLPNLELLVQNKQKETIEWQKKFFVPSASKDTSPARNALSKSKLSALKKTTGPNLGVFEGRVAWARVTETCVSFGFQASVLEKSESLFKSIFESHKNAGREIPSAYIVNEKTAPSPSNAKLKQIVS
jgi:CheY-like chemotaxis protein